MYRKLTLALVAAASLSAVALAPSAASAKPWGSGWAAASIIITTSAASVSAMPVMTTVDAM